MLYSLRRQFKHALLERWGVPHSPVSGMSPALYRRYRNSEPLALVDIGAHTGWFTKGLKCICPLREVLLVEPIAHLAEQLGRDPDLPGYRVADCAVADIDGEIELKVFPERPDMSSTLVLDESIPGLAAEAKTKPVPVWRPARRLDTVAAGFAPSGIDLIKIDVQGLEHLVIRGGAETLARTKAVFTEVSFRAHYLQSSVFTDIHTALRAHGFIMTELEPGYKANDGELLEVDALFVKPTDDHSR